MSRTPFPPRRRTLGDAIFDNLAFVGFGLVVLFMLGFFGFAIINALHTETRTCTVEEKDRTSKSEGGSDARLYTEQCGVLHVSDSLLSWHFNSADTYAGVEEGHTYRVTTRGFRVPLFSMFPNVVDADEVDQVDQDTDGGER